MSMSCTSITPVFNILFNFDSLPDLDIDRPTQEPVEEQVEAVCLPECIASKNKENTEFRKRFQRHLIETMKLSVKLRINKMGCDPYGL